MHITMIGTGYVGLVSGTCFANIGHYVTCVDKDPAKIDMLNNGEIPIYEPGLSKLVRKNKSLKRLDFTTNLKEAIKETEAIFIAVGTPTAADGVSADLSAVYAVAREIAEHLDHYAVIVTKSTVPIGTNLEIQRIISEINPDLEFDIASNPEFLREGNAIGDFLEPDRVVVGITSDHARFIMGQLYSPLRENGTPILMTTPQSAELIKYASNAFLATKISFINQMADLCEVVDGDIDDIAVGIGLDKRIGSQFLRAGPGYGGSCFPKDTRALTKTGDDVNMPITIIEEVINVNVRRKQSMAERIKIALGGDVKDKKIGILGVAFKPNTDDMRDSPALDILPKLVEWGADVHAYDPVAMKEAKHLMKDGIKWCDFRDQVIKDADCIALVTEWEEFLDLDMIAIKELMKHPIWIDLRNAYETDDFKNLGFNYHSIGRMPILNYKNADQLQNELKKKA